MIQILDITLHNLRSKAGEGFLALFLLILILNIRYNTSDFSPEQTHPQNAGSAGDEFVPCNKKFVGKIDTNLAS